MTQFIDLPNEIVALIAQNVYPRDIVNFSSTSKLIHSLCERSLKVYQEMKRIYKTCRFPGHTNLLAYLLSDIILQPTAALYVESLTTGVHFSGWREFIEHKTGPLHAPYPQSMMSRFAQAMADTIPSDQVSTWTAALESGDQDPVLALILLRLPGIITLELKVGITLQCLFQTLIRSLEAPRVPFLSALTTLHLDLEDSDVGELGSMDKEWRWQAINIFASLPSLQSVTMRQIPVEESVSDRAYLLQPRSSNVTSITIRESFVPEQPLYKFLQGFKSLRRFTYITHFFLQDPVWTHTALLAHCKLSLEYLYLNVSWGDSYMGSLRDFENLKEVYTPRSYLLDDRYPESQALAKVLPASIEKVHLVEDGCFTAQTIQNIILNVAKDKQKHLPNLQALRLSLDIDDRDLEDMAAIIHMQAKCKEAGFKLTVD